MEIFAPASEREIEWLVLTCPNQQCKLDPVPTPLVKDCCQTFTPIFTKIINASQQTGIVPSSFKRSIVTLLLKKNTLDTESLQNYRPVSNLYFISLLEWIVACRLSNYKDANNLKEKVQSAYRCYHSIETAFLKIHNDLMAADRG